MATQPGELAFWLATELAKLENAEMPVGKPRVARITRIQALLDL
jgi:hypothetical protein